MIRFTVKSDLPNESDVLSRFTSLAAKKIRKRIIDSHGEPKSGRRYRLRSGEGFSRFHVASAKGETVARRSGKFDRSLEVIRMSSLDAAIESNLDYPHILAAKMDRPYIEESQLNELIPELENDLAQMLMR